MAEYLTNTTDLTKVAAAIREKGGTSDPLVYPDGFVTAIGNIQTGGATTLIAPNDITFFDCDGTVIDAWTMEELQTKTALPEIPVRSGWSAGYWNCTLQEIKDQNLPIDVAAIRIPVDSNGNKCIRICLPKGKLTLGVTLSLGANSVVLVNFGDGSQDVLIRNNPKYDSQFQSTSLHTYPAPGYYEITFTVNEGYYEIYPDIVLFGKARSNSNKNSPKVNPEDYVYLNAIQEMPSDSICPYNTSARTCFNKSYYSTIDNVSWVKFFSLNANGSTDHKHLSAKNATSLQRVSIPIRGGLGKFDFTGCTALTELKFSWKEDSTYSLPTLTGCTNLTALYTGITSDNGGYCTIKENMFSGCVSMKLYDFSRSLVVIPLDNVNAFTGIPDDCEIHVKASLYNEWKSAPNWTTYADHLVPIGIYTSPIPNTYGIIGENKLIEVSLINYSVPPECSIAISDDFIDAVTVDEPQITTEKVSFNVTLLHTGTPTITLTVTGDGVTYERSFVVGVYETIPETSITVVAVDGATYGFALNSNGYYESQNRGASNSYALCRVNISNPMNKKLYFDCINDGEPRRDYGLLGAVNQELTKSNTADTGVKQSFKEKASTAVQTIEYDNATGNCFIDVKFRKDTSRNSGNDSLQFKVRLEETT